MHSDFIIAVRQRLEGYGIVEILGIRRVYSEGQSIPEILSSLEFRLADFLRNLVGGILNLRLETVWEVELRKNGMHLGVVVAGLSKHIHNVPARAVVSPVPAVNKSGNLEALLSAKLLCLSRVHLYVIRHIAALHQHPGTGPDHMEHTHERFGRTLYDVNYLTLTPGVADLAAYGPAARGPASFGGNCHPDGISIQRTSGLGCAYKYIFLLVIYNDEGKSLTGHLDFAYELGEYLFALSAPARLGFLLQLLSCNFCFHFGCAKIRNRV